MIRYAIDLIETTTKCAMYVAVFCLCLTSASAWSADAGWFVPADSGAKNLYLGAGVSRVNNDIVDTNQDGSVSNISKDDEDTSTGLIVGYQITDNISVEGGYTDMGETDFRGVSDGSGDSWFPGSVRTKQEADGWEFGVMGRWPIAPRWYALGYLGWYWWESKETYYESGFISSDTDSGGDVVFAVGFEYDVGVEDRFVYRFMGSQHEIGNDGSDVVGFGAELIYLFP